MLFDILLLGEPDKLLVFSGGGGGGEGRVENL